jgi:hypothetical protein
MKDLKAEVSLGGDLSTEVHASQWCTYTENECVDGSHDECVLPRDHEGAHELRSINVVTRAGREGDAQPMPIKNAELDTQSVATAMILRRRELGVKRYGTALLPNNGRDSLWDAVEEALDTYVYLLNYWREQHPGEDTPS